MITIPKRRIATLRRLKNMTQKELGQKLGVGQTTVSAWETGKTTPDVIQLRSMAQLFHVSIDYLLGYEADKEKYNAMFNPTKKFGYFVNGGTSDRGFAIKTFGGITVKLVEETIALFDNTQNIRITLTKQGNKLTIYNRTVPGGDLT